MGFRRSILCRLMRGRTVPLLFQEGNAYQSSTVAHFVPPPAPVVKPKGFVIDLIRRSPVLLAAPFRDLLYRWEALAPSARAEYSENEREWLNAFSSQPWLEENSSYSVSHWAAEVNDLPLMAHLKNFNVSLIERDHYRNMPLHYAAKGGHVDMIDFLRENISHLNPKAGGEHGKTVAHLAVEFGRIELLQYCLDVFHFQFDALYDNDNVGLVLTAARRGQVQSLNFLQAQGCDLFMVDKCNRNGVHYAAEQGMSEVIEFYAQCGEECLTQEDRYGATPAHYAARRGNVDTLKTLSKLNVNLNAGDNDKRTPLFWAVMGGKTPKHLAVVEFLVQHGNCLVSHQDEFGYTAASYSAKWFGPGNKCLKYLESFCNRMA